MSLIPDLPAIPAIKWPTLTPSAGNGNPITPAGGTGGDIYTLPDIPSVGSFIFTSKNVIILLGLLLIAAGLFSFDKTRELVVGAAKTGAKAGAAALA